MTRLPKDIRALLDASGAQWEVRKGKKHSTLWIEGRPVAVVNGSPSDWRTHKNNLSNIKRALREATPSA